ncbi:MAG: peptidoglycan -binding protein [Mangrovicoccus sp.]|nr:peptidoglycan -binding protein [Mangrovicoccus sp.]
MALSRRNAQRFQGSIWPGFVDAMTALLLVLIFVLSIFMVVQSIQTEEILGQESELDRLGSRVLELGRALGQEQQRASGLEDDITGLNSDLDDARAEANLQQSLMAALRARAAEQATQLGDLETQLAGLLADRDAALEMVESLEGDLLSAQAEGQEANTRASALDLALAQARAEIDEGAEVARLAAAKREALEALIADLEDRQAQGAQALSEAETARLLEAEAAAALRARLEGADAELTSLSLALEAERKQAEETLTLLAAAELARDAAQGAVSEAEQRQALLQIANQTIAENEAAAAQTARDMVLLNQQVADLRGQLGQLQGLLEAAETRDADAQVQIENLGARLNAALAQAASEQRRRADLEEAERVRLQEEAARLAEEAQQLEAYRSDFFGRLREILGDQEGVQIVGDRFVFSSEVLFDSGSAELSFQGASEIAKIATVLRDLAGELPAELNWVIRVDGHTDNLPLSGAGRYRDNWELSQARALSVVRFLTDAYGFPPERLAATGFGEYQPVDPASTPEARARNRRIEIKLTER